MSAVGISILSLGRHEEQLIAYRQKRIETRQFARNSAKIALARLQEIAGIDAVSTSANADPQKGFPHLAWNVTNPPAHFPEKISSDTPVPLCSGNAQSRDDDRAEFLFKTQRNLQISAPWEYVGDKFRFAYLIIDESQKFPLVPPKQIHTNPKSIDRKETQEKQQLLNFNYISEASSPTRTKQSNIPYEQLRLAQYDPELFFSKNTSEKISQTDTSLNTFGIIADWQRNRLKKNLSDNEYFDELFPKDLFKNFKDALPKSPYSGLPIATAAPKSIGKLGIDLNVVPVPAEIRLHIGFFNARSDGQHRARFHITTKLWNPNAFPILTHADGQFGLIDFKTLPTLFIQNLDTGGKFSVDLSNFPIGRFGLVRQTPSDKTFNAHCKIFDASDQGFGDNPKYPDTGLHAGEIYLARFPDPKGQPNGLSRISGGPTWKFQKGSNPKKPPSKAIDGRWFHDLHKINIFSMPSMLPGEIVLRHYNGSFPQSITPEDYASPIISLKNIQFPYIDFTITGKEYNREKAGDYTISQANLVYRIRLKHEDENAMKNLLENCDLRNGILDFANPAVAEAFEISAHTGKRASILGEENDESGYFFDRFINEHRTEESIPAFSSVQIYDLPNREHASAGTLRFLQMRKLPPLSIGKFSQKVKSKKINQIPDRYFFSLESKEEESVTSENPLFVHKDQIHSLNKLEIKKESAFAEQCMIRGPFNINSTNEKAWGSILSNVVENWIQFSGRHNGRLMSWDKTASAKKLENVFFTRPFSAQFFSPDGKITPLEDHNLEKATERSREQLLLGQGFRSIRQESLTQLAGHIKKGIEQRLQERRPFKSISDLADSGLIEGALERTQINTICGKKIPAWFPNYLRQEHILETLFLRASPRGDTFTIILRAEQINPLTHQIEAAANLEMRVQRLPDLFDSDQKASSDYESCNGKNRRFGRRFKIISIKN